MTRDDSRPGKKERVLHTRVPAVLERELKRLATSLKVPVSNLVRAILEDAVDAVDAVGQRAEGELRGVAERLARQRESLRARAVERAGPDARGPGPATAHDVRQHSGRGGCPASDAALHGVIGFEALVLAADAACTVCGRALPKGSRVFRGVRDEPGPRLILGPECRLVPANEEE